MDDGRPVILLDQGIATNRISRGYVENVASAIALAIADNTAAGRIYNVGDEPVLPRPSGCGRSAALQAGGARWCRRREGAVPRRCAGGGCGDYQAGPAGRYLAIRADLGFGER